MAFLQVESGFKKGQCLDLLSPTTVLGRHPTCHIPLDNVAVSRQHAHIALHNSKYYLEDLHSRNHTLLNNQSVEKATRLHNGDRIQICDFVFSFHCEESTEDSSLYLDHETSQLPALQSQETDSLLEDKSSIVQTYDFQKTFQANASDKLQAILEISNALGTTLELRPVLNTILERLLGLFPQTNASFIILRKIHSDELSVAAQKHQHTRPSQALPLSRTIIERTLQSGNAILSANALEDSRFDKSDSISDLNISSTMCVPLLESNGNCFGVIQLTTTTIQSPFTQDDIDLLVSVATQISLAIQNARLHEKLIQQRDYEQELEFAMRVQLGFLPKERPDIPGYQFFDYYEAAKHVGGDYFDYIKLPEGKLAVVLADVAGKGVPAALLMARLLSSTRNHLLSISNEHNVLTDINAEMSSADFGFRFITYLLMILDPNEHTITLSNAGHMPPIQIHSEGQIVEVGEEYSGMPIGVQRDQAYEEYTFPLAPEDTILIYTDGITEAMTPKRELFGTKRLISSIQNGPRNPEKLIKSIIREVDRFSEEQPQHDDMCLVAFQRQS